MIFASFQAPLVQSTLHSQRCSRGESSRSRKFVCWCFWSTIWSSKLVNIGICYSRSVDSVRKWGHPDVPRNSGCFRSQRRRIWKSKRLTRREVDDLTFRSPINTRSLFLSKNTFISCLCFKIPSTNFFLFFCMQFQLIFIGQKHTKLIWIS